MKIIYWRWKKNENQTKTISKDYIQEDLGDMLELADTDFWTAYPLRVLKKEIEIIRIEEKEDS